MPALLTPRIPAPPVVGLLASVTPTQADDLRWGGAAGWGFTPLACDEGWVEDPCAVDTRVVPDRPAIVEGNAFAVAAGDRCSTMDYGGNFDELVERARAVLAAVESKRIAEEFWTGAQTREAGWENRYLTHIDADNVTDGPSSATVALACLEAYLADCGGGGRGMIHASRQTATHWKGLNLIEREGGTITTISGTPVIVDAGYDGSGPQTAPNGAPTPAADGSVWAYATTPVSVWLGPVEVSPSGPGELQNVVDRAVNDYVFVAARLAAVAFDVCCHAAAEIDLPLCAIGGAGS